MKWKQKFCKYQELTSLRPNPRQTQNRVQCEHSLQPHRSGFLCSKAKPQILALFKDLLSKREPFHSLDSASYQGLQ